MAQINNRDQDLDNSTIARHILDLIPQVVQEIKSKKYN